jgi:hypothetical protein
MVELNMVAPVNGCVSELVVGWPSSDEETKKYIMMFDSVVNFWNSHM